MLSELEHKTVKAAEEFADRVVIPNAERWNTLGRIPAEVYRLAASAGLCRLLVAEKSGGLGLSVTGMASVAQALAARCFATAFSLVVHNNLAARIARNATQSMRKKFLPALMSGETVGAFLLTEPGVGSDAAAIQTRATRCEGGWRINGCKAWVSNGAIAGTLSVYAQTDAALGAKGIACFLVDAGAPGVERQPAYELLGGHALATAGFEFHDCLVEDDALLVAPGDGFGAALQGIDIARINVAAMCCGMLGHCIDAAVGHVRARHAFGKTIADFQGIQWMLADAATDLEASRLLAFNAARLCDEGEPVTVAAAHAKKFATRMALVRIADCMQVMGAHGMLREHGLARHLTAAKMAQYVDGATEIQNVVLSRALFKEKG